MIRTNNIYTLNESLLFSLFYFNQVPSFYFKTLISSSSLHSKGDIAIVLYTTVDSQTRYKYFRFRVVSTLRLTSHLLAGSQHRRRV